MPDPLHTAAGLGAALAAGLLVGLERGWQGRELPEGGRVAGLRTFALIGLLGGVLAIVSTSPVPLALGLTGVALLFVVSFGRASAASRSLSITSGVAAMVTFGLGAIAAQGHVILAVGTAAVVALLLELKGELHEGMRRIQPAELNAVLQLGVLTAAILPLLPDRGYGPYDALNPFRLWLAVIVIAALSLAGHVAARWRGPRQGLLWAGLLGALASSTAATLSLARTARAEPALHVPAAAGIVAACGVMFLRMAAVAALLQPALALRIGGVLVGLGACSFAVTAWLWHRTRSVPADGVHDGLGRAFDLPTALGFGAYLGAIGIVARAAKAQLGDAGVFAVAFVAGLADVDAPMISSLQLRAHGAVDETTAIVAIVLAVAANMVVKAAMAWVVGGPRVGRRVTAGYLVVLAGGAAAVAIAHA